MKYQFDKTDIIQGAAFRVDSALHTIIKSAPFADGTPRFNLVSQEGRRKFASGGAAEWMANRLNAMGAEPATIADGFHHWQEHEIRPGAKATTATGERVQVFAQPNALNYTLAFLDSSEAEPGLSPETILARFNRLGFVPA